MPGKVKVKIIAGRNLPVMDRSSDTTDAYVEIKLGGVTHKTDVARKTLNPRWNSDWFRFEMDDSELQDEPLQIRIMDHDTYSANDAIGKVNVNLNPLLLSNTVLHDSVLQKGTSSSGKGGATTMSGWIPVFDTMNGIRGEVEIIVKVDLFIDVNKFRQSSCGVQFFHSPNIPHGYHVPAIHGFVEELIANDDPEYQWIDKIRTPRSSNEARQVVFLRLSAQVQRKIGLKASELGANAVIGYRLCLDLEGDVGVVARGIGTAVTLVKIPENIPAPTLTESALIEENESTSSSTLVADHMKGSTTTTADETLPSSPVLLNLAPPTGSHAIRASSVGAKTVHSPTKAQATAAAPVAMPDHDSNGIFRRSSDSDLSVTPKGNSVTSCERSAGTNGNGVLGMMGPNRLPTNVTMRTTMNIINFDMLEYPFLTVDKFPPGFIVHLGSSVCARSVKLLERVANADEPEMRDGFWTEIRMEVRSHARSLGCNVVLGYTESTAISDDVCVLSATGTAALINMQYVTDLAMNDSTGNVGPTKMTSSLDRTDFEKTGTLVADPKEVNGRPMLSEDAALDATSPNHNMSCSLTHLPYNVNSVPFNVSMEKCAVCRRAKVPDILVATIEPPEDLQIQGRGCFVQAQVCRLKRDLKSESNAKEISDALPFLEYELHRLLINKLKVKGMNAIFGLKWSLAIGEKTIVLIATGTGMFLSALPGPVLPKIVGAKQWPDPEKINDIQKTLKATMDKNRELYQVAGSGGESGGGSSGHNSSGGNGAGFPALAAAADGESDVDSDDDVIQSNVIPPTSAKFAPTLGDSMDLTLNNKDICILEVDDIDDLEVIALLMEPAQPDDFHIVNTRAVPGLSDSLGISEGAQNMQYFAQVWRGKFAATHLQNHFAKNLQKLLQGISYKLRTLKPCAVTDLRFSVDIPDAEWVQVLITGMALRLSETGLKLKNVARRKLGNVSKEKTKRGEDEMIFNLEEDPDMDLPNCLSPTNSLTGSGSVRKQLLQTPSNLKLKSKSPNRFNGPLMKNGQQRYGVDITPLCHVPGGRIERYLGNLNFFFIRECTSIRENGGMSGLVHSFIAEVLAVMRGHVTALGGNAMVSFYMTEMTLNESIHKNQGQCLISVGGDVVDVSYFNDD